MKKIPPFLKHMVFALAVLAVIAKFSMDAVNDWSNDHAWRIVQEGGFEPVSANSFKHAFTAAYGYAKLRDSGLGEETSRSIIETLGYANEMFEYVIWRPSKRDSAEEVYKDLWNNLAGIGAAENLISNTQMTDSLALRIVLRFHARESGLKLFASDGILPMPANNEWRVWQAIKAYQAVRETVIKQQRALLETYPNV